jgi:hypothetical protein
MSGEVVESVMEDIEDQFWGCLERKGKDLEEVFLGEFMVWGIFEGLTSKILRLDWQKVRNLDGF